MAGSGLCDACLPSGAGDMAGSPILCDACLPSGAGDMAGSPVLCDVCRPRDGTGDITGDCCGGDSAGLCASSSLVKRVSTCILGGRAGDATLWEKHSRFAGEKFAESRSSRACCAAGS
eukprot:5626642-Amphidinium_carterae.1